MRRWHDDLDGLQQADSKDQAHACNRRRHQPEFDEVEEQLLRVGGLHLEPYQGLSRLLVGHVAEAHLPQTAAQAPDAKIEILEIEAFHGLLKVGAVTGDLALPLHEVLQRDVQFVVGGLIGGLRLHLLVVLVGNALGDNLVGGRLLLLAKRGNLAVDGGGLGGQLLHGALVGGGLDLRERRCLLMLQGSNTGYCVLNNAADIAILTLDRGERLELARVEGHGQSARRFEVDGSEQLRPAVFQSLCAVDGLADGRGKLSHRLTELRTKQLKSHRLSRRSRIADVAFDLLGQGHVLLHLLQLLVKRGDGFGPLGDLGDFVLDGNGIGHDGDRVLRSGQRC